MASKSKKMKINWNEIVECPEEGCGMKMTRKYFHDHQQTHSGPVSCVLCRRTFSSKRSFRTHFSKKHRQVRLDLIETDDVGQVKITKRYVNKLLSKAHFKSVDETSLIAHDFLHVMPTIGKGFRDYVSYLSKQNDKYRVPHVVLESKTLANVIGAGPTYTTAPPIGFRPDPSFEADKQATNLDYECSGYDRAHLAVCKLNVKDVEDFVNTFLYVNCAPVKGNVNTGVLSIVERTILLLVYRHNKILNITATIFPDDDKEVEYLNSNPHEKSEQAEDDDEEEEDDGETEEALNRVGIPSSLAKIVFFRDQNTGLLHARGWEVPTSGNKTTAKSCEVTDVQALAKKAKLDITFDMENDEILPRDSSFTDLTHRCTKVRIPPKKKQQNQGEVEEEQEEEDDEEKSESAYEKDGDDASVPYYQKLDYRRCWECGFIVSKFHNLSRHLKQRHNISMGTKEMHAKQAEILRLK